MTSDLETMSKKRHFAYWVIFGLGIFIFLGSYYQTSQAKKVEEKTTYLLPKNNLTVLGEADTNNNASTKEAPIFLSENFKLAQINLDNNSSGVGVVDFEESDILRINDIKSELYSVKDGSNDKETVKAIVSCSTTKRSNVEVEYVKSGEKIGTTVKDVYYGLGHTIIISGLDPDSVYKYSVKAMDLNNNKISSDQFVFYTGAPNVSLMTVLENAAQKVFGWAIKK